MDWAGSEDAKSSEQHIALSVRNYADAEGVERVADSLAAQAVDNLLSFADVNWDIAGEEDAITWEQHFAALADQQDKEAAIQSENVERAVLEFAAKKKAAEIAANVETGVEPVRARTPHPSVGVLEPVTPPGICVYCAKSIE